MLGSGHIGVWLSRQTEKEVISSCEDHLSKVFQVVDKFKQFIEKYVNNDVEGCHHLAIEISNLEREADQIKKILLKN
jgi:uncharacterized protein Yka (UPF0111/DUF47 family)